MIEYFEFDRPIKIKAGQILHVKYNIGEDGSIFGIYTEVVGTENQNDKTTIPNEKYETTIPKTEGSGLVDQAGDSSLPNKDEFSSDIAALETSSETVPQTQTDRERLVELLRDFGIPEDFWGGFEQIGNTVVLEHGDGLIGLKCDFNFDSGGAFKSWGVWE